MTIKSASKESDVLENSPPRSVSKGELKVQNKTRYWNSRFVLVTVLLAFLAFISGYLQYSAFPALMSGPAFQEYDLSLHLSFLTYRIDAWRCVLPDSCQFYPGLPSFDFAQLFGIILILVLVYHYAKFRK